MRTRYIVTYDICDPKRLRDVFHTVRGFGTHLQYSVFRCDLTAQALVELEAALLPILHHDQDQVLIIALGPTEGRGRRCIRSLGRAYQDETNRSVVV
jgi:CRISPR-associated protein Cas2